MSRRSKRQAFACKAKMRRTIRKITLANQYRRGFMGVARAFSITTKDGATKHLGVGAVFITEKPDGSS